MLDKAKWSLDKRYDPRPIEQRGRLIISFALFGDEYMAALYLPHIDKELLSPVSELLSQAVQSF